MPKTNTYAHPEEIIDDIVRLQSESRKTLINDLHVRLMRLDPQGNDTLKIVVSTMMDNSFEQKRLAELLGTSRTQIARWALGSNIPRQPAFRGWVVGELLKFLKDHIDTELEPSLPQAMAGLNVTRLRDLRPR